jgi:transposase
MLEQAWAGVDVGKEHHHCVVIDGEGRRLLSRRVANDEAVLLALISDVTGLAGQVRWAVDISTGEAALLLALLAAHDQQVCYLSGHQVNRAAGGYRGSGKTDAKDAAIIADQARMRRDLAPIRVPDEVIVELRMLVARRRDLQSDRVRAVNRLHETLLTISPALEKALDLTNQGPLILLTGYQTPAAIGQLGVTELTEWLRARKVRRAGELATRAVAAANAQQIALPGEALAAHLVAQLAEGVIALDEQIKHTDKLIEGRFHRHHAAPVILSMPGIGFLLGAEFLAATGGDTAAFATPDRLAGYAGLAPAPGLRSCQRQPLPTQALQPATPARLLHLRADQHPVLCRIQNLLRPKTCRRQTAQSSGPGAGSPPRQRSLGSAAGSPALPSPPARLDRSGRLTNRLRIAARGGRHGGVRQVSRWTRSIKGAIAPSGLGDHDCHDLRPSRGRRACSCRAGAGG